MASGLIENMKRHSILSFAVSSLVCLAASAVSAAPTLDMGSGNSVQAIAASPDGKTLAVIAVKQIPVRTEENEGTSEGFHLDYSLQLWSIPQRKLLRVLVKSDPSDSAPNSIVFSPDSRFLACGTNPIDVQLWDVRNYKRIWTLGDIGGPQTVSSVAFSPDGKSLVTGLADENSYNWGRIVFWKMNPSKPSTMKGTARLVTGGKCNIQSVAYSPDGKTVVSGSWGYSGTFYEGDSIPDIHYGELRFLDARSGQLVRLIKTKSEGIDKVVFSLDGKLLATTAIAPHNNVAVRVRDAKSGTLLHTLALDKPGSAEATFLADSETLAIGKQNGTVILWDVKNNKIKKSFHAHKTRINAMTFVSRSNTLITGSEDGMVKMWKMKS